MSHHSKMTWSKVQIQSARQVSIAPLLLQRGLHLHSSGGDNFKITEMPGVIIKNNFWHKSDDGSCGNTIDFLVKLLGMSFQQAMETISSNK